MLWRCGFTGCCYLHTITDLGAVWWLHPNDLFGLFILLLLQSDQLLQGLRTVVHEHHVWFPGLTTGWKCYTFFFFFLNNKSTTVKWIMGRYWSHASYATDTDTQLLQQPPQGSPTLLPSPPPCPNIWVRQAGHQGQLSPQRGHLFSAASWVMRMTKRMGSLCKPN